MMPPERRKSPTLASSGPVFHRAPRASGEGMQLGGVRRRPSAHDGRHGRRDASRTPESALVREPGQFRGGLTSAGSTGRPSRLAQHCGRIGRIGDAVTAGVRARRIMVISFPETSASRIRGCLISTEAAQDDAHPSELPHAPRSLVQCRVLPTKHPSRESKTASAKRNRSRARPSAYAPQRL